MVRLMVRFLVTLEGCRSSVVSMPSAQDGVKRRECPEVELLDSGLTGAGEVPIVRHTVSCQAGSIYQGGG